MQSDQSLRRRSVGSQGTTASSGGCKDSNRPADAQADLSLHWTHTQSCKKWCVPDDIIL